MNKAIRLGDLVIILLTLLLLGSCTSLEKKDKGFYEPTWNSLGKHATPEWFKDAKFGIYTHWGGYSVPAKGPNDDSLS